MKICTECGNKIPFRKYLFLSNHGKIVCENCHQVFTPDKKVLTLIGGISGFSSALTVGLGSVIYYLSDRQYLTEIIIIVFLCLLSIFVASAIITRNIPGFTKTEKPVK